MKYYVGKIDILGEAYEVWRYREREVDGRTGIINERDRHTRICSERDCQDVKRYTDS